MLEELSLSNCGLTAVPAALLKVCRSLRRLDLSRNLYRLDEAVCKILEELLVLQQLDVTSGLEPAAPSCCAAR